MEEGKATIDAYGSVLYLFVYLSWIHESCYIHIGVGFSVAYPFMVGNAKA